MEFKLEESPGIATEPIVASRKAIQDVLLAEGMLAVKASVDCQTLDGLRQILLKKLGQNSIETRRRYAQSIAKWFFADGVDGFLRRVWLVYQDESILTDLLRLAFLEQEPSMGVCVCASSAKSLRSNRSQN